MNSLKLAILSFCLLSCSRIPNPLLLPAPGVGGDEVTNGGGVAEKNAVFVFLNLGHFLAVCAESSLCATTAEEKDLVARIGQALKANPSTADQIVFASEKQKPGTFLADGRSHGIVRSAVTGKHVGAPIWLNVDHLYQSEKSGYREPLELPALAALLLDEVAHHVEPRFSDPAEHGKLDSLCGRFRAVLGRYVQQISGWPKWKGISVALLEDPELLVSDSEQTRSLTSLIAAKVKCPEEREKLIGFQIRNLHWGKGSWEGPPNFVFYRVQIEGWVVLSCTWERPPAAPMTIPYQKDMRLSLRIQAQYEGDTLTHWTLPTHLHERIEISQ